MELLAAVGIGEDPEPAAARAAATGKPERSQADRFQQGLQALAAFVEWDGHARAAHWEALEPVELPDGGGGWWSGRSSHRDLA
ncbi:hypothetical protein GCM10009665_58390 [Kitasatospora nipponensis]|uniref:Uncharacterized protein n=1 Tax=Kitasatospora nipponensis TaxID=258049 RepID=A0ABP4HDS9_9ACTN